jgi:DNA (cytosine-5)-methyltransferase 1
VIKPVYNILSLFTGAGAFDFGFELSGQFKTVLCVECERTFCKTLIASQKRGVLADAHILESDITALTPDRTIRKYSNLKDLDGIIGGPPCESFSSHGRRQGLKDPRGNLVFVFMEWVKALRPKFFLMENVPLLGKLNEGQVLQSLIDIPSTLGYSVDHRVLNASHFGAATKRKRLFILGFKGEAIPSWPQVTHGESDLFQTLQPLVSAGEAWENLPEPSTEAPGNPQGHLLINHSPAVMERFASLRPGQYDNVRKRSKLTYDKPSPALVAGNLKGIRSHIHPEFPRELTNRESARLHGFPDDFEFCGNHAAMGKQVANSVPIPLVQALAEQIAIQLNNS